VKTKRYRYQIQFACFDCRKVFKRPFTDKKQQRSIWLSRRTLGTSPLEPFVTPVHHCPDCNGLLTMMCRAFRAPRQTDIEQWGKAEFLVRSGFQFHSSAGRYPDTLNQARKFMASRRKISAGEELAIRIQNRPT
jgi:hypothetical protein